MLTMYFYEQNFIVAEL